MLGIEGVAYFLLSIIIDNLKERPSFRRRIETKAKATPASPEEEDADVVAERNAVVNENMEDRAIVMSDVTKVYTGGTEGAAFSWAGLKELCCGKRKKVSAVRYVTVQCHRGDIFGFLGANGAGKTTTFKMLCGIYTPTSGAVRIMGVSMFEQLFRCRQMIGYCPQYDALVELLNPKEHLTFYSRLRGIPEAEVSATAMRKLGEMDLLDHQQKRAGRLSGGNKRKLMVAISTIGDAPIVLLDEPSAGMDPMARRFMWDAILQISSRKSTVVITTHSMEECEALCNKTGIMVNGVMRTIGNNQSIKRRYGQGYELYAKMMKITDEEQSTLLSGWGVEPNAVIPKKKVAELTAASPLHQALMNAPKAGLHMDDEGVVARVFAEWWFVEERIDVLGRFLQMKFPGAKCLEKQGFTLRMRLSAGDGAEDKASGAELSTLFDWIESSKSTLRLQEYSLSPTTLEQIFSAFVKEQVTSESDGAGTSKQSNASLENVVPEAALGS
jgi:ATP-binding cassette subfamily A (ABC1) protein 1